MITVHDGAERLGFDRRMAHHIEQLPVTPDIVLKRRDVEIADEDGASFGDLFFLDPVTHLIKKIELVAEFGIDVAIGFVTACRFATWPTRRSPLFVKATTDGVRRLPSGLVMTTGSPPSMTATTELVVPRSMPMILLMCSSRVPFRAGLQPA